MITVSNHPVPNGRLNQFHDLLVSSGGWMRPYEWSLRKFDDESGHRVDFFFEDVDSYNTFSQAWTRLLTPITEKRSPWYKRMWRKIKGRLIR